MHAVQKSAERLQPTRPRSIHCVTVGVVERIQAYKDVELNAVTNTKVTMQILRIEKKRYKVCQVHCHPAYLTFIYCTSLSLGQILPFSEEFRENILTRFTISKKVGPLLLLITMP